MSNMHGNKFKYINTESNQNNQYLMKIRLRISSITV